MAKLTIKFEGKNYESEWPPNPTFFQARLMKARYGELGITVGKLPGLLAEGDADAVAATAYILFLRDHDDNTELADKMIERFEQGLIDEQFDFESKELGFTTKAEDGEEEGPPAASGDVEPEEADEAPQPQEESDTN